MLRQYIAYPEPRPREAPCQYRTSHSTRLGQQRNETCQEIFIVGTAPQIDQLLAHTTIAPRLYLRTTVGTVLGIATIQYQKCVRLLQRMPARKASQSEHLVAAYSTSVPDMALRVRRTIGQMLPAYFAPRRHLVAAYPFSAPDRT
eukprot:2429878-Rhodomonas_salina.2